MRDRAACATLSTVLYVFEPYVFDTQFNTLSCRNRQLALQPKTLEVLRYLIDRSGELVERRELFESIWANEDVSTGNLAQHVFMLRQAFAEATPEQRIVVTVPGRGYRFVPEVARQPAAPVESTAPAWRLYLRGRFFADRRTRLDLLRAFECFEDALEVDESFALAHEGLAEAHALYAEYLFGSPVVHFESARRHAERAVELNSGSGEAYAVLGDVSFFFDWDRAQAKKEYARAVELLPASQRGRSNRAWFLAATGNHAEALSEVAVALRYEPTSPKLLTTLAALKLYSGRYDEALDHCDDVLTMDPSQELVRYYLALALLSAGETRQALAVSKELLDGSYPQHFLTTAACAAAWDGQRELANEYRQKLDVFSGREVFVSSLNAALVHLALGETAEAMGALREGVHRRDPWLVFLDVHPLFEPLRTRSDFSALRSRMSACGR